MTWSRGLHRQPSLVSASDRFTMSWPTRGNHCSDCTGAGGVRPIRVALVLRRNERSASRCGSACNRRNSAIARVRANVRCWIGSFASYHVPHGRSGNLRTTASVTSCGAGMKKPSLLILATVIFGPVVLAAILQPVVIQVDADSARSMVGWCVVLSLTLLGIAGLMIVAVGMQALIAGQWPIVDPMAYPMKPRAEKRGVVARVIGVLYVVLGFVVGGSALLLAGTVLNAFAIPARVAG